MAAVVPPELGKFRCAGFSADCGAHEAPFNVLLTTYTLFERDSHDSKQDRAFLKLWQWSCLVLDEAHAVKNRNARRTTAPQQVPFPLGIGRSDALWPSGKGRGAPIWRAQWSQLQCSWFDGEQGCLDMSLCTSLACMQKHEQKPVMIF